CQQYNRLPTF
nr:immunoglobulin light chain junction region [Macaca mulatta]